MSVLVETTLGDIVIDLFTDERERTCKNFLKLCKIKYYNFCTFHYIKRNFIAQTGDPTGRGTGGESIFASLYGTQATYFEGEKKPRLKHVRPGTVSMVNQSNVASQFFITLGSDLTYLDDDHTVFGQVVEGFELVEKLNDALVDGDSRPYQDPFEDPDGLCVPSRSPSPNRDVLESDRMCLDEELADEKALTVEAIDEEFKEKEARAQATVLEMIGDLPSVDVKPPENVLFVCKLNPATCSEDLHIIFSRFGEILSCEVIRDWKTGNSLQYAFIEFDQKEDCEKAYFKMDNVLIDDRRIHVDFSQSVSKMRWQAFLKQRKGFKNGDKSQSSVGTKKLASALSDNEDTPNGNPAVMKSSNHSVKNSKAEGRRGENSKDGKVSVRRGSPASPHRHREDGHRSDRCSRKDADRKRDFSPDRNSHKRDRDEMRNGESENGRKHRRHSSSRDRSPHQSNDRRGHKRKSRSRSRGRKRKDKSHKKR